MYKFIVFLLRLFKFYSKLSKSDSGSSHDSIFQGTRRSNKKNTPRNRNPIFSSGLPLSGHTLLKKYSKTRFRHLLFFLSIPISREASQTLLSFVMLPNVPSFFTLSNHFSKKFQKKSEQEDLCPLKWLWLPSKFYLSRWTFTVLPAERFTIPVLNSISFLV